MKQTVLLLLALLSPVYSFAVCRVVSPAGAGSKNGTDWNNAYQGLPATLIRGDTYYLADGVYGPYNANTAASGTTLITIKKAIASDHCTDTGWVSTLGDGQAAFNSTSAASLPIVFLTGYWTFDGQVRTSKTTGYGFVLSWNPLAQANSNGWYFSCPNPCPGNITGRYFSVEGHGLAANNTACNTSYTGTVNTSGTAVTRLSGTNFQTSTADFETWNHNIADMVINGVEYEVASVTDVSNLVLDSSAGTQTGVSYSVAPYCATDDLVRVAHTVAGGCANITLQYIYLKNSSQNSLKTVACDNGLLEYSVIDTNGGGSYFHGQGFGVQTSSNWTVRYNDWINITGTAVIAIVTSAISPDTDNGWEVYGNTSIHNGSFIGTGLSNGWWACINNATCGSAKFYNNSISDCVSIGVVACAVNYLNTASGDIDIKNNLWYNNNQTPLTFSATGGATVTRNYNTYIASGTVTGGGANDVSSPAGADPFVNAASGDFHLIAATDAGASTAFTTDPDGLTRGADGVWDRGAFEFQDGAPVFQTVMSAPTTRMGLSGTQTITVTNVGNASTDGTTATFVLALPTGVTATALAGTGWSCTL